MSEPQTLSAAFFGALIVVSGVAVHLFREVQKLHAEAKQAQSKHHEESKESQAQMLRVLAVTEKALESFNQDSEEIKEAVLVMKERQASIMKMISPTSSEKSQRNLPR